MQQAQISNDEWKQQPGNVILNGGILTTHQRAMAATAAEAADTSRYPRLRNH